MDENTEILETPTETRDDESEGEICAEIIDISSVAENADKDEEDAVSEYNDTAAQISEMETALAESTDNYRRLFAEYDNFRKRTAREKAETYGNATMKCIETLLPIIDNFERAVETECADENYKKGMTMIFSQFKEFLVKNNVKEVDGVGCEFDPNIHNAISQAESEDYASGIVCQVYIKGYKIGDKLIRPAMVSVAN